MEEESDRSIEGGDNGQSGAIAIDVPVAFCQVDLSYVEGVDDKVAHCAWVPEIVDGKSEREVQDQKSWHPGAGEACRQVQRAPILFYQMALPLQASAIPRAALNSSAV